MVWALVGERLYIAGAVSGRFSGSILVKVLTEFLLFTETISSKAHASPWFQSELEIKLWFIQVQQFNSTLSGDPRRLVLD